VPISGSGFILESPEEHQFGRIIAGILVDTIADVFNCTYVYDLTMLQECSVVSLSVEATSVSANTQRVTLVQ